MRKVMSSLVLAGVLALSVSAANAVTFASFDLDTETPGITPNPAFRFNNGTGVLNLITSPTLFTFNFANSATSLGLPLANVGLFQNVNLTFSSQTNGPGTDFGTVLQPMTNVTFTFTTTQAQNGVGAGTVLLSGTGNAILGSQGIQLSGASGGNTASLLAQDNAVLLSNVSFTSGIASLNTGLAGATQEQIALSFTSVNPGLIIPTIIGTPSSFTASGNGTFAATPNAVPEPGSMATLLGIGVSGTALLFKRRKRA
jgi:hypothetical protein